MRWTPLLALIVKDLKIYFHDRRAVMLTFAAPILFASFFGWIFGGAGGATSARGRVEVDVVDRDDSELLRSIVRGLKGDENLQISEMAEEAARGRVREGKAPVAVVLPSGFAGDLRGALLQQEGGGKPAPQVAIAYDPSKTTELALLRGVLAQHVMEAVGSIGTPEATAAPPRARTLPFGMQAEALTARPGAMYNGYAHSLAGMGVQFVLMAGIEFGIAVLLERQRGLWRRIRSAPVSRGTLLVGRLASITIIGASALGVAFAFGVVVLGVRVGGSWLGLLGCIGATALLAASLGLLVAAVGRTPQATRGVAMMVVLVLVMLGGAWVPSFFFPAWLQRASLLLPTRWAIDGMDAMTWRALPLSSAGTAVGVLVGYAVVMAIVAFVIFPWEGEE